MAEKDKRTIKTADRTFDIVEGLDELGQAGVTELADHVGIPKSTLYQYLTTLRERDVVVKQDESYRLSLRLLGYGTKLRGEMPLYKHGRPYLRELAEETGEIAWIAVEEHGLSVTLGREIGENGLDKFAGLVGGRTKMHTHAAGKAILAHLPESRVDEIIREHGLPSLTDATIKDRDTLFEELSTIRERGYAFNDEETIEGLRAVAVPIETGDEVLGSIAVGGPANRLDGEYYRSELPELVMGVANELKLQTSVSSPW